MTDSPPSATSVLVAPDSFKGTFAAEAVASALARGLRARGLQADECPVGDGGEGTSAVLRRRLRGQVLAIETTDPNGSPIMGEISLVPSRRAAVIDVACASGLDLTREPDRDPWTATTSGTGVLIAAAAALGVPEIIVAAGGSGTVDGGAGALEAIRRAGGIGDARLTVLCDVSTAWEECARIYGPQKGADAVMVRRLESRLDAMAMTLAVDPRGVPMTGAAGGLAGALWSEHDAKLVMGAPYVLQQIGFDERLAQSGAVVIGEGRLDEQSFMGKIAGEIVRKARKLSIPVHAVVGSSALDSEAAGALGLSSVTVATTLAELETAGRTLGELVRREAGESWRPAAPPNSVERRLLGGALPGARSKEKR